MPDPLGSESIASLAPACLRRRRAWLYVLPLAEAVVLSVCIDTGALAGRPAWWARWLGQAGEVASVLLGAVAATAMVVFLHARHRRPAAPRADAADRTAWPFLLAHFAAFVGFGWLTAGLVEGRLASSPHGNEWLLVWVAAALAAGLTWGLAVAGTQTWARLVRRGGSAAAIGLVIGAFAWVAGRATGLLWVPLRGPTFRLVEGLLAAVGQDVVSRPAEFVLGTAPFHVAVDSSCSGYEGIGLIWAFLGGYLWLFRRSVRLPRALLLIPIGTVAIWLANAARIAALVLVGTHVSPAIALGGFHSRLGWLAFIAVALGLVGASRRMSFFTASARDGDVEAAARSRTAAWLMPLLAGIGAAMCTGAFAAGVDRFYFVRVVAIVGVLWFYWRGAFRPRDLLRSISAGAVAIGAAVFAIWMGLEWAGGDSGAGAEIGAGLAAMPAGWAAAWLAARVVGSVIAIPVAEELAFRGYLLRRLIRPDFEKVDCRRLTWLSLLASSMLFGAMHGRWLAGTVAGVLYALAVYRRGRLADAIVAHATTNALIAAYVLATGRWALWA